MTEPRRVRTQVERDADGVAWRQTADTRPGFATYPQTPPGTPSWWRHDLLAVRTADGRMYAPADVAFVYPDVPPAPAAQPDQDTPQPCRGCHACATDPPVPEQPPADRSWIEMTVPPRRRWWHRLTRRNP